MTRALVTNLALIAVCLLQSACSEQTRDATEATARSAAADTQANLEVVGQQVQLGAAQVAGKVSEGAADLRDDLADGQDSDAGGSGQR